MQWCDAAGEIVALLACHSTSLGRLLHLPPVACRLSFVSHSQWSHSESQFCASYREAPISRTNYGHLDSACSPWALWHHPTPSWPACVVAVCPVSCGELKEIEIKCTEVCIIILHTQACFLHSISLSHTTVLLHFTCYSLELKAGRCGVYGCS